MPLELLRSKGLGAEQVPITLLRREVAEQGEEFVMHAVERSLVEVRRLPGCQLSSDNYSCRRIASQRLLPGRGRCLTIRVTQGDTMSSVSTQRGRSYRLPVASIATPS